MNKATFKMHYRLMRLSFGKGKSVYFHALAGSLVDVQMIAKLANLRFNAGLDVTAGFTGKLV